MGYELKCNGEALYRVYDEMACDNVLFTDNFEYAKDEAYNYQAVLFDNLTGKVICDYSC